MIFVGEWLASAATLRRRSFIQYAAFRTFLFVTKKEAKKSRCCEAARLAAKTMADIQQSWPARAVQSPALGALNP